MTYNRPGRAARGAFTLTEILVVILIIAVLVSITAAGVLKIMSKGPELRTSNDIRQLELAIQQFQQEFSVNYIPSYLVLREDNEYNSTSQPEVNTVNYLKRVFGKNLNLTPVSKGGAGIDWNGNGQIDPSKAGPFVLQGQHCLVFFLGGIPSVAGGANSCLGFSTNPQNPATQGGTRRGPFFQNWETNRLQADPVSGFFTYLDAWPGKTPTTPRQPYAYFSAYGVQNGYQSPWSGTGDCSKLGLQPYYVQQGTLKNFANPNTYQIVSAGRDNTFGVGGPWSPGGGGTVPPNPADGDNQTNFTKGILEAGQ